MEEQEDELLPKTTTANADALPKATVEKIVRHRLEHTKLKCAQESYAMLATCLEETLDMLAHETNECAKKAGRKRHLGELDVRAALDKLDFTRYLTMHNHAATEPPTASSRADAPAAQPPPTKSPKELARDRAKAKKKQLQSQSSAQLAAEQAALFAQARSEHLR